MTDKLKEVQEVVWTGKSNRQIANDAELFDPEKSSPGKLLRANRGTGGTAGDLGKPIYPKAANRPQARPPVPPVKKAPPRRAAPPAAPMKKPVASAKPPASSPKPPAAVAGTKGTGAMPRQKGRFIARAVVGSFVDRLKAEARSKGGTLTLKDIESLEQEFEQKTAALESLFEKTFEDYARAYANGDASERRGRPFDRLIVQPFERLFPGGDGPSIDKGGISRRILPGFFMGVNMMVGPDVMADYHIRAKKIFKRIGGVDGGDWRPFYDDPEAQDLRLDALIAMAVHFSNPDKRANWFMSMINDHLTPVDPTAADAGWRLARPTYERLVDALFADLMTAVSAPKARNSITKRFGPETCALVAEIMKGLGA